MQPIYITDPAWRTTFPHLVAPLPDEWLPGLLLRCDQANHWESGCAVKYVLHAPTKSLAIQLLNLITPPLWVLERLAQALAIPVDAIVETTHLVELARLSSIDRLVVEERGSSYYPFYLCPECFARDRFLRRTLMLSHIKTCLQHQLKLVRTCQCGMGLNCFDMETPPFICRKCGCSWEDLPRIEASPERIVLEEQLQSYYAFFFSVGTPRLLSQTFELIEMRSLECGKKSLPFDALSEETGHGPRYIGKDYHQDYRSFVKMKRVSLGKLAYALVDLELSIGDILKYAEQAADCISDVNDDRISYQGDYCNSMNKSVLTEQSGYRTKSA